MASFTVATKMSPIDAYRRLEPPSTLMQSTSLAPLLSATRSRDSCWIIGPAPLSRSASPGRCDPPLRFGSRSSGAFQNFADPPALQLGDRSNLGDPGAVALL